MNRQEFQDKHLNNIMKRIKAEDRKFFWQQHEVEVGAVLGISFGGSAMWAVDSMSWPPVVLFGALIIFGVWFSCYISDKE
jgi:hypothetical protein